MAVGGTILRLRSGNQLSVVLNEQAATTNSCRLYIYLAVSNAILFLVTLFMLQVLTIHGHHQVNVHLDKSANNKLLFGHNQPGKKCKGVTALRKCNI
jgi:hypothetical protein